MAEPAGFYDKHVFVCINERAEDHPRGSCGRCGGWEIRARLLQLVNHNGLQGKVRANKSMCLDVCESGPAMVIYPDNTWYVGFEEDDVDEIFETSVLGNGIVDRLVATDETFEKQRELRKASSQK